MGAELGVGLAGHRQPGPLLDPAEPVADGVLVHAEGVRRAADAALIGEEGAERRHQVGARRIVDQPADRLLGVADDVVAGRPGEQQAAPAQLGRGQQDRPAGRREPSQAGEDAHRLDPRDLVAVAPAMGVRDAGDEVAAEPRAGAFEGRGPLLDEGHRVGPCGDLDQRRGGVADRGDVDLVRPEGAAQRGTDAARIGLRVGGVTRADRQHDAAGVEREPVAPGPPPQVAGLAGAAHQVHRQQRPPVARALLGGAFEPALERDQRRHTPRHRQVGGAESRPVLDHQEVAPALRAQGQGHEQGTPRQPRRGQRPDHRRPVGHRVPGGAGRLRHGPARGLELAVERRRDGGRVAALREADRHLAAVVAVDRAGPVQGLRQRFEQLLQRPVAADQLRQGPRRGARAALDRQVAARGFELGPQGEPLVGLGERRRRQLGELARRLGFTVAELARAGDVVHQEQTENLVVEDHRHRHDRADVPAPHGGLDHARVLARVGDDHRAARPHRLRGEPVGRDPGAPAAHVFVDRAAVLAGGQGAVEVLAVLADVGAAPLDPDQPGALADDLGQHLLDAVGP